MAPNTPTLPELSTTPADARINSPADVIGVLNGLARDAEMIAEDLILYGESMPLEAVVRMMAVLSNLESSHRSLYRAITGELEPYGSINGKVEETLRAATEARGIKTAGPRWNLDIITIDKKGRILTGSHQIVTPKQYATSIRECLRREADDRAREAIEQLTTRTAEA